VSYNLKKLVELGYMHHQRSEIDRRSVRVRLTEKGRRVRGLIGDLFAKHAEVLGKRGVIDADVMETINATLKRIERFWTEQIRYIY
jgi:DNA-binding MarR family transcriptional regulator